MAEPDTVPEEVVVQLVLDEVEEPWPVGGTKMVNDDRPVDNLVEVTTMVDRVVVHVDDEDDPESSVPEAVPVPDCPAERLPPVGSVDESSVVVHVDDTELAGGHSVVSDSEALWDPDEPVVAGLIVRVCTLGEPEPLVVPDVAVLESEPEPVEEVPDLVTVRTLGPDAVAVADDPGTVYVITSGDEVPEPAERVVSVVKVTTVGE